MSPMCPSVSVWRAAGPSGYDRDAAVRLFRELEFFKVLNRLPALGGMKEQAAAQAPDDVKYSLVDTAAALDQAVARLTEAKSLIVRLVTERRERSSAEIVGIALGIPSDDVYYVPLGSAGLDLPQTLERLRPVLADERIGKLAHDGKEVIKTLAEHGVELRSLEFDTMIAAYLLGEKGAELPALALSKLGIEIATPQPPSAKRSLFHGGERGGEGQECLRRSQGYRQAAPSACRANWNGRS